MVYNVCKRWMLFLGILCVIGTVPALAQEDISQPTIPFMGAPDYDQINQEARDANSDHYYPSLLKRYQIGDTTLTLEDYRYLYYGYPEQPDYKPLLQSQYADSLERAFGRKTSPTADDYRRVVRYAGNILLEEPFSMRDMNALAFAYQMLEEPELAARQMRKIQGVMDAILSTGEGLSEESPWHITYVRDAEDILNILGARYTRMLIISRSVGFIPVSNMPDKRHKGYYFDYSEVYKRKPDYLEDAKRKLQVNPKYNPNSKQSILPK